MKTKTTLRQPRTGEQNIFRKMAGSKTNFIFEIFFSIFMGLSSWPSSIIEVFMRRSFGSRYFTLATSLGIITLMIISMKFYGRNWDDSVKITWCLFAFIYLLKSIKHRKEIKKYGSTYNFDRFSLSEGLHHDFWHEIIGKTYLGVKITHYRFYVFLEPALPFFIGAILAIIPLTREVGVLVAWSSIFFAIRHFGKCHIARNSVLDMIDDMIVQQLREDVILEQKPPEETSGLSFPFDLPKDRGLRQKLADSMKHQTDDNDEEVLAYS